MRDLGDVGALDLGSDLRSSDRSDQTLTTHADERPPQRVLRGGVQHLRPDLGRVRDRVRSAIDAQRAERTQARNTIFVRTPASPFENSCALVSAVVTRRRTKS